MMTSEGVPPTCVSGTMGVVSLIPVHRLLALCALGAERGVGGIISSSPLSSRTGDQSPTPSVIVATVTLSMGWGAIVLAVVCEETVFGEEGGRAWEGVRASSEGWMATGGGWTSAVTETVLVFITSG